MAALRLLAIRIARNSQKIIRLSYEVVTPYDLSQRRKEDFDMLIALAICLRLLRSHGCRTNSCGSLTNSFGSRVNDVRIRTVVGLRQVSIKCCECQAIVARLPNDNSYNSRINSYDRRTKSSQYFRWGHYIALTVLC